MRQFSFSTNWISAVLIHYCGGSRSRSHSTGIPSSGAAAAATEWKYGDVIFSSDDLQRPPIESADQMVYLVAPSSSGSALSFPAGRVRRGEHTSACRGRAKSDSSTADDWLLFIKATAVPLQSPPRNANAVSSKVFIFFSYFLVCTHIP